MKRDAFDWVVLAIIWPIDAGWRKAGWFMVALLVALMVLAASWDK